MILYVVSRNYFAFQIWYVLEIEAISYWTDRWPRKAGTVIGSKCCAREVSLLVELHIFVGVLVHWKRSFRHFEEHPQPQKVWRTRHTTTSLNVKPIGKRKSLHNTYTYLYNIRYLYVPTMPTAIPANVLSYWIDRAFSFAPAVCSKACSGSEYTKVTFWPDFSRFGMTGLDRWGRRGEDRWMDGLDGLDAVAKGVFLEKTWGFCFKISYFLAATFVSNYSSKRHWKCIGLQCTSVFWCLSFWGCPSFELGHTQNHVLLKIENAGKHVGEAPIWGSVWGWKTHRVLTTCPK